MTKWLSLLKTSWGRLTAGIAAMLAVAWMNEGQFTGRIDWDSATVFIGAFLVWLYSCLPETLGGTNHDKQLFSEFLTHVNSDELLFLREQDFQGSFLWEYTKGSRLVANTWHGPYFEFDDGHIQKQFSPIIKQMSEFFHDLAVSTQPIGVGAAKINWDFENEQACAVVANRLNGEATAVVAALDAFIPMARRRLE